MLRLILVHNLCLKHYRSCCCLLHFTVRATIENINKPARALDEALLLMMMMKHEMHYLEFIELNLLNGYK
jgi:hypothetical protein